MFLQDRINILKGANLITEEEALKLNEIIDTVYKKHNLILTEANASSLITHLFGVQNRFKSGEVLEDVSDFIMDELKQDPNYQKALGVLETINEIVPLTDIERNYVLMHVITVYNSNTKFRDGLTYSHEHMCIDLSGPKQDPDANLNVSVEAMDEIKHLYDLGVRNICEMTNLGMGRNLDAIKKIMDETGMNILVSTGSYKDPFLPEEMCNATVDELVEIYSKDYEDLIAKGFRVASFGEVGSSNNVITEHEEKLFRAAARVAKKYGIAIVTHTTLGTMGLDQIKILKEEGVDLSKVIISHVALKDDYDYIKALLDTGVNVAFDTIGKVKYLSEEKRVEFITNLVKEGYINQMVMSVDITRKSHLKKNGGIGYSYLLETFVPMLIKNGLTEDDIKTLLTNASRIMG